MPAETSDALEKLPSAPWCTEAVSVTGRVRVSCGMGGNNGLTEEGRALLGSLDLVGCHQNASALRGRLSGAARDPGPGSGWTSPGLFGEPQIVVLAGLGWHLRHPPNQNEGVTRDRRGALEAEWKSALLLRLLVQAGLVRLVPEASAPRLENSAQRALAALAKPLPAVFPATVI